MKRLLLLALMVLLVAPAMAVSMPFQDYGDFVSYTSCSGYRCSWVETAGNNYMDLWIQSVGQTYLITYNAPFAPFTYGAATLINGGGALGSGPVIILKDSVGTTLYTYSPGSWQTGRYEVKMVGNIAEIYLNNRLVGASGALAVNPSYIWWGGAQGPAGDFAHAYWDDVILGSTENKNIFGACQQGMYIENNQITPGSSGLYFANGTLASSFNMTTSWGMGSANTSQTIVLEEFGTGNVVSSFTTGGYYMSGTHAWPVSSIINTGQYGYYVTTILGTGEYSQVIPYRNGGAVVLFDRRNYSQGTEAQIYYNIAGTSWLPATYSYKMEVRDIYGNIKDTQTVSDQFGTKFYTFTTSDAIGVYYAVVIATPIGGSTEYFMSSDTTEVVGYATYYGYVYDANTTLALSGALVNLTQGTVVQTYTTGATGYYSTVGFTTGTSINMTVSKSGYRAFHYDFMPRTASNREINHALIPNTPLTSGRGIGGVVHESTYGSIIPSPYVSVKNATTAENYVTTGNIRGYYLCDNGASCSVISNRLYDIWGSKTGYSNSTTYQAVGP